MQNQVKKFVFAVSLAGMVSMTAPAMAAPHSSGPDTGFLAHLKSVIVHILDIVEVKTSLPPG